MIPTATSRVCVIVGHPITQVRSPELFNRRFEQAGIEAVMVPVDIEPPQLAGFLAVLRGWHNCAGGVLTVPHKRAATRFVDRTSDRAQRLGAVNVLRRHADGALSGDLLDGIGFMAAAAAHGFEPWGRSAAVFGAGGAGSAIADALCEARIGELAIADVDADRAEALRAALAAAFPAVTFRTLADRRLDRFELVVNASPVGMDSVADMPVDAAMLDTLRPTTLVADVVTRPPVTAFLAAAYHRGCRIQTGAEMAEGQLEALGRFMRVLP